VEVTDTSRTDRTYGQYCGLARALDLVGERWALLVVRELLLGPKRFTDLLDGLPGVSTNVLATRLRQLERGGIVVRNQLPPPAASAVYELTGYGRALEEPVAALGRWGATSLGTHSSDQALRSEWLAVALTAFFHPEATDGAARVFEVRLREGVYGIRVADGALDVSRGPADGADLVLEAEDEMLVGVLTGQVRPEELSVVEGDPAEVARFVEIFRFGP
jgi:DNA-binding HxlR family transcriptional regulator